MELNISGYIGDLGDIGDLVQACPSVLSSVVIPSFNVSDVCSLFFIQYGNVFFVATVSSLINFSTPLLGSRGGVAKTDLTIIAQVEIPAFHDAIFGFTLLLRVLSLTQRGFSPGTPISCSLKTNISKFEFDQESGRQRTTVRMCYLFNTWIREA